MHDEHTAAQIGRPSADEVAAAVLSLLLQRHPELVSFDELVRALTEARERPQAMPADFVGDGVSELVADGLVRQLGPFVIPTRAAIRADKLIG
jgi:hypothetical protein